MHAVDLLKLYSHFLVQNNLLVPVKIRPTTLPYKTEYEEEEKLNFELPLTDNMNTIKLTDMPVMNWNDNVSFLFLKLFL